jgi:sulfur-oxidizing protein SoxZ
MVARVNVPAAVKRGDIVPVRIAILHPMETGYRFDVDGRSIAKNVIHSLTCRYLGEIIFRAEMGSGVSANPNVQFYVVAERSGELQFEWSDDAGQRGSERVALNVSG